jgi:hypothetical protein
VNTRLTAVAIVLALVLCAFSGVVEGVVSGRWGQNNAVVNAPGLLAKLPSKFGPWELEAEQKLSAEVENILESPAYKVGTFVNRQTGDVVGFALLAGPPGPISVHTPDICASSAHYEIGDRRVATVDGPHDKDEFWRLDLKARSVDASPLRVYYAWGAGKDWQASDNPRVSFATSPLLYKLQIAFDPSGSASSSDDVGRRFLADYLRAIDPILSDSN